jgi:hypothetical protein
MLAKIAGGMKELLGNNRCSEADVGEPIKNGLTGNASWSFGETQDVLKSNPRRV